MIAVDSSFLPVLGPRLPPPPPCAVGVRLLMPHPAKQVQAGILSGVLVAPLIPCINDEPLERIVAAAAATATATAALARHSALPERARPGQFDV